MRPRSQPTGGVVHMVLTFAAAIVGLGADGLIGQFAWLWRGSRPDAARTRPPRVSTLVRAASRRQHRSPRSSTRRGPLVLVLDVRGGHWPPAGRENGRESWMSSSASTTAGACGRGAGARFCYGWVRSLRWSWQGGSRCSPASTQWAADPLRPRWKAREPPDRDRGSAGVQDPGEKAGGSSVRQLILCPRRKVGVRWDQRPVD